MKKEFFIFASVVVVFLLLIVFQTKDKTLAIDPTFDLSSNIDSLHLKIEGSKPGSVLLGSGSLLYYSQSQIEPVAKKMIVFAKNKYGIDISMSLKNSLSKDIVLELDTTLSHNLIIEIDKLVFISAKDSINLQKACDYIIQLSDSTGGKMAFPRFYYKE